MLSRSSEGHRSGTGSDEWIAIEDAASYLAIPVRTLYRLTQRGQLPGTKVGRTWRFKRSLLDAHLAGLAGLELSAKRVAPSPLIADPAPQPPPSVQEGAALLAEMAGLADLSIGLSRLSDAEAIARFVCERLQQVFSVDAVGYLRRTSERGLDELHLSTSAGSLVAPDPVRIPVAASPLLRGLIETAAPLVLDDLPAQVTVTRDVVSRLGLRSGVLAPIQAGNEITGVLILVTATRRRFTPLEVERLVAVAGQMGTALANAHLVAQSDRWTEQLEGIEAFSRELNRHRDVAQLGEALADGLAAFVAYDAFRLYVIDPDQGDLLEPVTLRANEQRYAQDTSDNMRLTIGEGIAGAVARDGTPALVDDIDSDPRRAPIAGRGDFEESMLAVPLSFENRTLGVLVLCRLGLAAFSQDDLRVVQILAAQTSVALVNARQFEELARRSERLERQLVSQRQLLAITERLLKTRDSKLIFDAIADTLSEVVPHDTLTIYLVDAKERRLRPILARDQYAEQILSSSPPLGYGITGSVVESGVAELVNDAIHDPRVAHVPDTPVDEQESIIVVPLQSPSGVIGALNLYRIDRHFDPQDLELAKLFGNHAALAIENAQAHEALLEAARTDPLTGLRHHGAFQDILREALRRGDATTSILMIDLDNFKAYNDRYGHQAGDRLLQRLAGSFLSSVRAEDTVSRYGGDEFALVLPGTDETGARATAEKILARISEVPTGARHVRVGASIGLACAPRDALDAAGLISVADTALYVAKQLGRGRVVAAEELPTDIGRFREVLERTMRELPGRPGRAVDPVDLVRPLHHLLGELAPEVARTAAESAELCSRVAPYYGVVGAERDALIAAALASHAGWPASNGPAHEDEGSALITLAHPVLAARLLEPYARLREVSDIVRHHHECWDGSGYPDGLRGEQLNPPVRLLVAVERFLALQRAGPHGAALSGPDALTAIRGEVGTRLAPDAVEALAGVLEKAVAAA